MRLSRHAQARAPRHVGRALSHDLLRMSRGWGGAATDPRTEAREAPRLPGEGGGGAGRACVTSAGAGRSWGGAVHWLLFCLCWELSWCRSAEGTSTREEARLHYHRSNCGLHSGKWPLGDRGGTIEKSLVSRGTGRRSGSSICPARALPE